jgi:peptidoglycan/xylan/chitin deacetylase (PgdA/CDA1 family)
MERLALTFDDGPDPRGTPAVLDALAAAGARAWPVRPDEPGGDD